MTQQPERRVRGVLFIDYVKMLRSHKVAEKAGQHLKLEDAHFLIGRLDPDGWYPMATFERLGLAILSEIVGVETDSIRLWGRAQLAGLLRFFPDLSHAGDARDAIMRLQTLMRSLFDFECVTVEEVDDESAYVRVCYGMSPPAESAATWQTIGFFEELVTNSGAEDVASELKDGAFIIRWRMQTAVPAPLPTRPRVLVVDDQKLVLQALVRVLQDDVDVVAASGANEAYARLQEQRFDAVLVDLDLGGPPDGMRLLEEVHRRWPETIRVLHTGHVPERSQQLIAQGVLHAVVAKPATAEVILRSLRGARG
jgi:CheY-like chemotaxis protein